MRKLAVYGIIFFQILLIVSLIKGIQVSRKSKERLADLENTRNKLASESAKLKKEAEVVASEYYLEKVAREELHLVKPGETVVIVPEGTVVEDRNQEVEVRESKKANWEKWWELLVE